MATTEQLPLKRILLIEDNLDHAVLATKSLERSGEIKVFAVASAREGIAKLKTERFDLILCDYHLPDISGLELLKQMRAENIPAPFIMLTGSGDERVAVSAMQNGAYDYLIKDDVYLHLLPRTVRDTLEKYSADREREKLQHEVWEKNKQLAEMNQELLRLDQVKNHFIASVTHEFRTPLNAVRESLALLLDGIVNMGEKKARDVLTIAHKNIDRVALMIDDLLDFSKLDSGKVCMSTTPYALEDIVQETVKSLEPLAHAHQLQIVVKSVQVPRVLCDRNRIIQVITNLIGNAIKFTPAGGTITVWAEEVLDHKVKVSVRDTGIGIDSKMHLKVFEKFEQVERSVPGSELKGTGLGLAISRHIIEKHNGSIWVESALGKGSTFMFTLPTSQTNGNTNTNGGRL